MKKPARVETDWAEPFKPEAQASESMEQITAPGAHAGSEFIERNHEVQQERRARYRRDYQGNIPPAEHQFSKRTDKSSSRIRFPSAAFRRGLALIDWKK